MTLEQFAAFNVALLAAMLSPGPAFLLLVRTALAEGRLAGIATGCGLGLMAAMWTLLALLGLEAIFTVVPFLYVAAKILGAGYLLYLAVRTWQNARSPLTVEVRPARHAFRDGILINLANPKSVLFAAAVLILIFPADTTLVQKGLVFANHLVVEIVVYAILATVLSTPQVTRQYLRAKAMLDRFAALVMGALGIRLLFSR